MAALFAHPNTAQTWYVKILLQGKAIHPLLRHARQQRWLTRLTCRLTKQKARRPIWLASTVFHQFHAAPRCYGRFLEGVRNDMAGASRYYNEANRMGGHGDMLMSMDFDFTGQGKPEFLTTMDLVRCPGFCGNNCVQIWWQSLQNRSWCDRCRHVSMPPFIG